MQVIQSNAKLKTPTLNYRFFKSLALGFAKLYYGLEISVYITYKVLGQYYMTMIMPSGDKKDSL
jgi:hypothetical protein